MTQKFTTPCFIRKNTVELRKKLEELGYISDKNNLLNIGDFPCLYTYWHPNLGGIYNGITCYISNNYIDCGTNEYLFLALAALREDSEYMQWFTDGEFWDVNFRDDIPFCEQVGSNDFHKATVEEIINHFKNN